jgi:hypothetical protein
MKMGRSLLPPLLLRAAGPLVRRQCHRCQHCSQYCCPYQLRSSRRSSSLDSLVASRRRETPDSTNRQSGSGSRGAVMPGPTKRFDGRTFALEGNREALLKATEISHLSPPPSKRVRRSSRRHLFRQSEQALVSFLAGLTEFSPRCHRLPARSFAGKLRLARDPPWGSDRLRAVRTRPIAAAQRSHRLQ